jgi:sarcosine oxidase delta subunit
MPVNCPYCKTEKKPEAEYCITCRGPLTINVAMEAEKKEQELLTMLSNFPQMVENIVE